MCIDVDTCLSNLKVNNLLAVGVSRRHAAHYLNEDVSKLQIYCFDKTEAIGKISVSIFTRTNFELLPEFNVNIKNLIEAGIINKWASDNQKIIFHRTNDIYVVTLTLAHLFLAILCIFLGTLAAISAFIAEVVINYKAQSIQPHKFWILVDTLIDGKRHIMIFNDKNQQ